MSSDNFEMMVIIIKNVRNIVTSDMLFKALDEVKFYKKDYERIKKEIEKQDEIEKLI